MTFSKSTRTVALLLFVLTSCLSTPITDTRIRKLIKRIFYIPPSGEPYINVSNPLTASNDCSTGVCVPFHLCINGNVVKTGENLLATRIGFEDTSHKTQVCSKSETCCRLVDDDRDSDNRNLEEEFFEVNSKNEEHPKLNGTDENDDDYDYMYNWRPKCGIRNFSMLQPRISGETKAENMEFPWMMMVLKKMPKSNFYDYQCGGSLIHPSAVLTVAHCVVHTKPNFLYVRAGEWDMANTDESIPHQDRDIQSVVIHRDFYKPTLLNDIAILILKSPIEYAENVNTICLPPPNIAFDNERCLVTGWGKDNKGRKGKFQTVLKKLELPIVPNNKCQMMFRNTALGKYFRLDHTFICAGGEVGKDTCKGDGGSPLVCKIPNTTNSYYQSGIVSWGIGCKESNIPGAYVNVAKYRDWVDKVMRKMGLENDSYLYE